MEDIAAMKAPSEVIKFPNIWSSFSVKPHYSYFSSSAQ